MATSARLASAVGSANGRPGSRARRSPPLPPSRDPAACLPPLRPGRRGPGAPPLRSGRHAVPSAAPRPPRRRPRQRRSVPGPLDGRAGGAGRGAARPRPLRHPHGARHRPPAGPGQHASLPSGAPHLDFSRRLLGSTPPSPPAPSPCTAPRLLPAAARPSPVPFGESASLLPDPPSSCPQPSRVDSPLASQSAPIGS